MPARLRLVAVASLAGIWLPGALVVSLVEGWPGQVPLVLTVAELAAVAGTVSAAQVLRWERRAAAWVGPTSGRATRIVGECGLGPRTRTARRLTARGRV